MDFWAGEGNTVIGQGDSSTFAIREVEDKGMLTDTELGEVLIELAATQFALIRHSVRRTINDDIRNAGCLRQGIDNIKLKSRRGTANAGYDDAEDTVSDGTDRGHFENRGNRRWCERERC